MTIGITALEGFIATREDWFKNQLDSCGMTTPEKAFAWAFEVSMCQETYAELAVAKTLLSYLKEGDTYDAGLLFIAGRVHKNLPAPAVLKALGSIHYALTA
jgi:hypothetical protein